MVMLAIKSDAVIYALVKATETVTCRLCRTLNGTCKSTYMQQVCEVTYSLVLVLLMAGFLVPYISTVAQVMADMQSGIIALHRFIWQCTTHSVCFFRQDIVCFASKMKQCKHECNVCNSRHNFSFLSTTCCNQTVTLCGVPSCVKACWQTKLCITRLVELDTAGSGGRMTDTSSVSTTWPRCH